MKTLLKIVGAVGLIVFVAAPIAYAGYITFSNRMFASKVFAPIEYEEVLASRRWHGGAFGCTFAVVSLPQNAETDPPEQLAGRRFPYNMPSEWVSTPGTELDEINMGWFDPCAENLSAPLFDEMSRALIVPGGWWAASSEYVFLYSQPAQIAFRLRLGD